MNVKGMSDLRAFMHFLEPTLARRFTTWEVTITSLLLSQQHLAACNTLGIADMLTCSHDINLRMLLFHSLVTPSCHRQQK